MVKPGVPNIRKGYNVTDKADGLRCLAYCDRMGELYLIDVAMNVYRTGLSSIDHRESILDGEWVTHDREKKSVNMYLGRMMFRRLSSINQAFYLGSSLYFYDNYAYDKQFLDELKNVKLDDVKKAAQKYMVVQNPMSLIVR